MNAVWQVLRKELTDALRDRRTLLAVLLATVAMGPLLLALMSMMVSKMEQRAEARELLAQGMAGAPTLQNYLARQNWSVQIAPADYEAQLKDSKLGEPVLLIPPDFEACLARGEAPQLTLVVHGANARAQAGARRVQALLNGFRHERAVLQLAVRGVAPGVLDGVQVQQRDLADPASRGMQIMIMLPYMILMAVMIGAQSSAVDTMAGERERGSLEPLLMNPLPRLALVLGKWGAVAAVAMLIAALASLSFLPGQWLLRNETLAALFRFGWGEALAFIALLLPLAGMLAAFLMAVAQYGNSVKQAQANVSIALMAVWLVPLLAMLNQDGEEPWHLWLPVLAQNTLMTRVLKGEAIGLADAAIAALTALAVAALLIGWITRRLGRVRAGGALMGGWGG